jgi:formylglycine-generating enzyme required for sulfatase activity
VTQTANRSWRRPTAIGVTVVAVMAGVWFGAPLMHTAREAATPRTVSIENQKGVPLQTTSMPVATFKFETVKLGPGGSVEAKRTELGKFYEEDLGNGTRLDMVLIPAGKYLMGTPDSETEYADEHPEHEVSVPQFYMGQYEVTQAQWRAVTALPKVRLPLNAQPSEFKGDDLPVENISWDEANEFCARLSQKAGRNYRVPSEAEWEYAARAGTKTAFAFGDSITTDIANFDGTAAYKGGRRGINRGKTMPVGSLKIANAFGLYDTHGNVWEWCFAKYHDNYKDAPTDGTSWVGGGDLARRVVRGGSWSNLGVDCRSANRYSYAQDGKHNDIGVRIAMSTTRSDK